MLYPAELRAHTLAERILPQSARGFSALTTCRLANGLLRYLQEQALTHVATRSTVGISFDSSATGDW